MTKILFLDIKGWEADYIKENFKDRDIYVSKNNINEVDEKLLKSAEILSIFIYSPVNKEILDKMPNLKLIATRSTGYDHIDIQETEKRGIKISNVPFYGEHTVAEHAYALILSLTHNIHRANMRTARNKFSFEGLQGIDLKDKILGIVGGGHIGLHVAKIGRAFGMNVLVFDLNKNSFLSELMGFDYVSLDELFGSSDIITLHVPYNQKTHHLIGHQNINKIKKGAILINTARGALIDTTALVKALDEGILAGAGLDVLEEESLIKEERQILYEDTPKEKLRTALENHILLDRENVVITPHIAFNSIEAMQRILDTTIESIQAYLSGGEENMISKAA